MIFSAYYGNSNNLSIWKKSILDYTQWLKIECSFHVRYLNLGSVFAFCWLKSGRNSEKELYFKETEDYLVLNTSGYNVYNKDTNSLKQDISTNIDKNLTQIGIMYSGPIEIITQLTNQEPFYFRKNYDGYVFSNDLRLLIHNGFNLDEIAVYSLLKYAAIPAPFTISKDVQRIPNGYALRLNSHMEAANLEKSPDVLNYIFPKEKNSDKNYVKQIDETLDDILIQAPESSIVYFSGGVDSALIAARFKEIGRNDIRLINYNFGENDPSKHLAEEVAGHLKLPFEQIQLDESGLSTVLDNLAKDYSYPFIDPATIPSNLLIRASLEFMDASSTAYCGVSADSAFGGGATGKYKIWQCIYNIPQPIRNMTAEFYKSLKLWRINKRLLRPFEIIKISNDLAKEYIGTSNVFQDITYRIPQTQNHIIDTTIKDTLFDYNEELNIQEKMSLYNLIFSCANCNNALFYDPLRVRGIQAIDPFLDPQMVRLAYSIPWSEKNPDGKSKVLLKKSLANNIPYNLVYGRKKSFITPFNQIFTNPVMQEFLNETVFSSNNPLLEFVDIKAVRQIARAAISGKNISYDAQSFLWLMIFVSGWLNQLKTELPAKSILR